MSAPPTSPTRTLPILLHTLTVSASRVSCSQLNLYDNRIGPEGAKSLADALKVNASLTSIQLKNNKLGDEGWGAIFAGICSNKDSKIESVDASNNRISPAGAKLIGEALRTSVSASLTKMR